MKQGVLSVVKVGAKTVVRAGEIIAGVKIIRVLPGTNGKIAIIGRKMTIVEKVAKELEARGYKVELFNADSQKNTIFKIDGKDKYWDEISDDFGNQDKYLPRTDKGWVTDEKIPETDMYKANKEWAEKLKNEGYEVIDVGNPENAPTSIFYDMEQDIIF